jgi:acetoin utilization deacetylase AcuC-like enzyme
VEKRPVFVVDDPLFDEHRARGYHPERPERLLAARHAVRVFGTEEAPGLEGTTVSMLPPRDATQDEVARVHTGRYVELLEQNDGLFSALDDDTYLGPRSVAAAFRAAGGAIGLTDALLDAPAGATGIALLRPPGHHARPDRGMGFCLLNNVALAASHALSRGVRRVAVVDWDVHHGNGTQDAFYTDPRVLFVSLHQAPFYPGTGTTAEIGEGEGKGFNLNVPLSAGAGDAVYAAAFDRLVLPVVDQFAPELVLVSAGFDAHVRDPLAGMMLTASGFGRMATALRGLADKHAGGRIGLILEGGYDLEGLESSLRAALEAAAAPASPSAEAVEEAAPLSVRQAHEIERAAHAAQPYWKL